MTKAAGRIRQERARAVGVQGQEERWQQKCWGGRIAGLGSTRVGGALGHRECKGSRSARAAGALGQRER